MSQQRQLLLCVLLVLAFGALSDQANANDSHAYVSCSTKAGTVPTYENACLNKRSGEVACGERIEILAREGGFFKILTNTRQTYVSAASISRSPKKFDPIPIQYPVAQLDCAAAWATERAKIPGKQHPFAWFAPDPQYTDEARHAKLQGTVVLSFTVGTDGRASDIRVERSLGMGLDEQAVAAVSKWRFDPAREDGSPIPAQLHVRINFRTD